MDADVAGVLIIFLAQVGPKVDTLKSVPPPQESPKGVGGSMPIPWVL